VTARQLDMVQRMGLAVVDEPPPADLVIDALIGYSLRGDPTGRAGELIGWANSQPVPVLALDVPSGLDATSGRAGVPCVRAAATLTLALPKTGLARAPDVAGELYLADISVPQVLYERMGIEVGPLFADGPVLKLRAS
jgi:NAD(P)H-hydrate epimerase